MTITNTMLASQISELVAYWKTRDTELQAWMSGAATGGPYGDGRFPLTDYTGTVYYAKSPLALQASVTGLVSSASSYASAASASSASSATAKTASEAARDLALSYRNAAQAARDLAYTYQQNAATSASNASTWATSASSSATSASASEASATTSATNAAASASAAAASASAAATFDPAGYFAKLTNTPFVTGQNLAAGTTLALGTTAANSTYIYTNSVQRVRVSGTGAVTINAPTSGTALTVSGDVNATGGLQLGPTAQNAIYKGGTDFFIARNYSQEYTVWEVWAPPSTNVLTDNREATLALVREDTSGNAEYIDLYNNGYATGYPASVQHGLRIQKRGTGQYRPFKIDQFDGSTYADILTIAAARNVTIHAPTSGAALTVTGATGSTAMVINQGSVDKGLWISNTSGSMYLQASGGSSYIGTDGTWGLNLGTNNATCLSIGTSGNVIVSAPSSGASLTVNGISAGTAALKVSTSATTGSQTATFTATNKPGTGTTAPSKWLPIDLDGTTYYVPCWT